MRVAEDRRQREWRRQRLHERRREHQIREEVLLVDVRPATHPNTDGRTGTINNKRAASRVNQQTRGAHRRRMKGQRGQHNTMTVRTAATALKSIEFQRTTIQQSERERRKRESERQRWRERRR